MSFLKELAAGEMRLLHARRICVISRDRSDAERARVIRRSLVGSQLGSRTGAMAPRCAGPTAFAADLPRIAFAYQMPQVKRPCLREIQCQNAINVSAIGSCPGSC